MSEDNIYKYSNSESEERIKRIKSSVLLDLVEKEDEGKEVSSPEYDELIDKIQQACNGYDLNLIPNALLNVLIDIIRFDLDINEVKDKDLINEFIDKRLYQICLACISLQKFYEGKDSMQETYQKAWKE